MRKVKYSCELVFNEEYSWRAVPTVGMVDHLQVLPYLPTDLQLAIYQLAGPRKGSSLSSCFWVGGEARAGIFKKSMGARHQVGIGLSYRPAGYIGWRN